MDRHAVLGSGVSGACSTGCAGGRTSSFQKDRIGDPSSQRRSSLVVVPSWRTTGGGGVAELGKWKWSTTAVGRLSSLSCTKVNDISYRLPKPRKIGLTLISTRRRSPCAIAGDSGRVGCSHAASAGTFAGTGNGVITILESLEPAQDRQRVSCWPVPHTPNAADLQPGA